MLASGLYFVMVARLSAPQLVLLGTVVRATLLAAGVLVACAGGIVARVRHSSVPSPAT